jgi:hypothetical protein
VNCREFEQYLDQYLDRELEGTLKLEFEAHMVECESCGHMYAMMEAVGQIVGAPSPNEPKLSSDFTDRIMMDFVEQRHKTLRFRKILAASSVAASIGVILTGLVLFTSVQPMQNEAGSNLASNPLMAPTLNQAPSVLAMNDLTAKSGRNSALFDLKNIYSSNSASESTLAADTVGKQKQVKEDLNQWLASKLERAGNNLWEITQLRDVAWSQMRQGLIKSLASPFSSSPAGIMPTDSLMPRINSSSPDVIKEFKTLPNDEKTLESGVELL